jgi:hypothetical protein
MIKRWWWWWWLLFNLLQIFYVLWRFWYYLMVTRSKGRYQYCCMITYSWFIHSFIQYFNSVDHQNFLRNTQLSRHSRKKHGRIEHNFTFYLCVCSHHHHQHRKLFRLLVMKW